METTEPSRRAIRPVFDESPPLVSMVMTVWNGEATVGESVDSLLRQTFTDFELIVVDDGSTDGTCAVIESFSDPRIRLLRRPHQGIVSSANFGISRARGFYIGRLDADDLSLPDRLQWQIRAIRKRPETVLCYTNIEVFGNLSGMNKRGRFIKDGSLIALKLCMECPLTHSSVLYRKDAFERTGRYLEKTPVAEDYSLYTRLIREGPFVGVPKKLVKYQRQSQSTSFRYGELMEKIARGIAVEYMQGFLKVEVSWAEKIFVMLHAPLDKRSWRVWAFFCWRSLHWRKSWRPEPLAWLVVQTIKMLVKRFRKPRGKTRA